jgi:uncharacterized caspase-like protein
MARVALLIGISNYGSGLTSLPGASKDVAAMSRVLENSDIGDFSEVKQLFDPDPTEMGTAIQNLFDGRKKEDVTLLFFSGHGIKDEQGRLYLATGKTAKDSRGSLIKATAMPANFIHDLMVNSRSKQQIIILDCCFSGAFVDGLTAKDDGSVDLKNQLFGSENRADKGEFQASGEGRVILTSATSTQYAFEQSDAELSVYTRYLIEGLSTAAADQDNDEIISADELHEFAAKKVREAAPAMKPEIYAVKQGYKIPIAKALIADPKLKYRKEAERFASHGKFSPAGRAALDSLQVELGLQAAEAQQIEAEVLKPHQEYRKKLQDYGRAFLKMLRPLGKVSESDREDLVQLQRVLRLRDDDITPLEAYIMRKYYPNHPDDTSSLTVASSGSELTVEPTAQAGVKAAVQSSSTLLLSQPTDLSAQSTPPAFILPTTKQPAWNLSINWLLVVLTAVGLGTGGALLTSPGICEQVNPLICIPNGQNQSNLEQAFAAVAEAERLTREARTKSAPRNNWDPSILRKEWNAIAFNWQTAHSLLDQVLQQSDPTSPTYVQVLQKQQQCEAELAYADAMVKSVTATELAQTNRSPNHWQEILDKQQWQAIIELREEAIASLESITNDDSSETYIAAQRLISSYRVELSNARQAQAYAPLRRALEIAKEADRLQNIPPQNSDDWLTVASLWDQALIELQQVDPAVTDYYEKAQSRIFPYQNNRDFAQQMASG